MSQMKQDQIQCIKTDRSIVIVCNVLFKCQLCQQSSHYSFQKVTSEK